MTIYRNCSRGHNYYNQCNTNIIPEATAMQLDPTITVAFISLMGTLVVAALNQGKYTKADAVELERRLTKLEDSSSKVDLLYDTLVVKGLQLLVSPHTPELDRLMKEAMNGLDHLSEADAQKLCEGLDREYISNPEAEAGKRMVAVFIEAVVKKEKGCV